MSMTKLEDKTETNIQLKKCVSSQTTKISMHTYYMCVYQSGVEIGQQV